MQLVRHLQKCRTNLFYIGMILGFLLAGLAELANLANLADLAQRYDGRELP